MHLVRALEPADQMSSQQASGRADVEMSNATGEETTSASKTRDSDESKLRVGKLDGKTVHFVIESSFVGNQIDRLKQQIGYLRKLRVGDRFVLPGSGSSRARKERQFGAVDIGVGQGLNVNAKTYFTNAEWMYAYRELPLYAHLSDVRSTDSVKAKFARKRDGSGHAELTLADVNQAVVRPVDSLECEANRTLERARLTELERLNGELRELEGSSAVSDVERKLKLENRVKQLELVHVQRQVRNKLVLEQQKIMKMTERAYKKMVKEDLKI